MANIFEFHSLHSHKFIHMFALRKKANVIELLEHTFIASESGHFARKEKQCFFSCRYQGRCSNPTKLLPQIYVMLRLLLWADPFSVYIFLHFFRSSFLLLHWNSIVSSIFEVFRFADYYTALQFFSVPWNRNFFANIFLLNVSMYLMFFTSTHWRENFFFWIILHLIPYFVSWSVSSAAYSTNSTNISWSTSKEEKKLNLPSQPPE